MIITTFLDGCIIGDRIASTKFGMEWLVTDQYVESNIMITIAEPTDNWTAPQPTFELWGGTGLECILTIDDLAKV